jgi:hypothetical protein
MRPARGTLYKLLDRALIGFYILVVLVLLGMQIARAG